MQKGESNQSTKISLAYSLVSLYFGLWRVSLAEYLLVLRVLFTPVADDVVYHGYCANCDDPAADDE
jgi:hypothetical protein